MVGQPLSDFIILPEMVGLDSGWALGLEWSWKIDPVLDSLLFPQDNLICTQGRHALGSHTDFSLPA